jgi:hypothetical protein
LAAAILLGMAVPASAQIPGAPPAAADAAAQKDGPTQNVTIEGKKCCSIFDLIGLNGKVLGGVGKFFGNVVFKSPLGQAVCGVVKPLGKVAGLGPAPGSDAFMKAAEKDPGGAMDTANKVKEDQANAEMKVAAIEFLAQVDCKCYPEVVDALLKELDDCSEMVRYAALRALHKHCDPKRCCPPSCGSINDSIGDCCGCQCEKRVMDRLNALLLEREATGCLRERSQRVRCLATQMIEECLVRRMAPPVEESQAPIKPEPETAPKVRPEGAPKPAGSARRREARFDEWFTASANTPPSSEVAQQMLAETKVAEPETVSFRPRRRLFRSQADRQVANAAPVQEMEQVEIVDDPVPSAQTAGKGRRHLLGVIFGR